MPQDLLQQRAGSQRGEGGGSSNIVHQKILKYSEIKNKSQYKTSILNISLVVWLQLYLFKFSFNLFKHIVFAFFLFYNICKLTGFSKKDFFNLAIGKLIK